MSITKIHAMIEETYILEMIVFWHASSVPINSAWDCIGKIVSSHDLLYALSSPPAAS